MARAWVGFTASAVMVAKPGGIVGAARCSGLDGESCRQRRLAVSNGANRELAGTRPSGGSGHLEAAFEKLAGLHLGQREGGVLASERYRQGGAGGLWLGGAPEETERDGLAGFDGLGRRVEAKELQAIRELVVEEVRNTELANVLAAGLRDVNAAYEHAPRAHVLTRGRVVPADADVVIAGRDAAW